MRMGTIHEIHPLNLFIEKKERKKKNESSHPRRLVQKNSQVEGTQRWEAVNFQEFIGARREGWFSMAATSMLTRKSGKEEKEEKRKSGKL